jgi:uncharacterized membrane protein
MILLALGVLLLSLMHLVPAAPPLKTAIVARIGARGYGIAFGIAAIVLVAVIVLGWRLAGFVPVYEPPAWGRHANLAFTYFAFLWLCVFLFRGILRQRLRFPMGLAVLFWGTGHLFANGDLASLILFGGFTAYAVLHIAVAAACGVRPTPEVRGGHDVLAFLTGTVLYGAMTQLHPLLIGVPVLALHS